MQASASGQPAASHRLRARCVAVHSPYHLNRHCRRRRIEKWYTPCASQSPIQGPPSCYVEHKIEHVLGRIKKLQPKLTGILYYNSMFNFNFYHLNGMMEAAEARGLHSFLRDETVRN
eukprot:COSAG06_NODE_440_length_15762_cov_75.979825_12_plen_117_part_00